MEITSSEKGQTRRLKEESFSKRFDINDIHSVLGHPSEGMAQTTGKDISHKLTIIFQNCKDYNWEKQKRLTQTRWLLHDQKLKINGSIYMLDSL